MKTIRQGIYPDDVVVDLLDLLKAFPERALEAKDTQVEIELENRQAAMDYEEAKNRVDELRQEARFEIDMEVNDDGKRKYSNNDQREAATAEKLRGFKGFKEYHEAVEKMKAAKQAKSMAEMRAGKQHNAVGFVYNEFKSACAAAYVVGSLSQESHLNETMERLFLWEADLTNKQILIQRGTQTLHNLEVEINGNGQK